MPNELAKVEIEPHLEPGASYAIWSPFDAVEAAAVLQQLLANESAKP